MSTCCAPPILLSTYEFRPVVVVFFFLHYKLVDRLTNSHSFKNIENGKSFLYGVSSWNVGFDAALEFPGDIFASVFSMIDFVNDVLVGISKCYTYFDCI